MHHYVCLCFFRLNIVQQEKEMTENILTVVSLISQPVLTSVPK